VPVLIILQKHGFGVTIWPAIESEEHRLLENEIALEVGEESLDLVADLW
jgi:hypothetical protein